MLGILVLAAITIAAYVFYQINNIGSKPFSPLFSWQPHSQPPVAPIVLPALTQQFISTNGFGSKHFVHRSKCTDCIVREAKLAMTQQPLSESYAPRDMRPVTRTPPRREIELKRQRQPG